MELIENGSKPRTTSGWIWAGICVAYALLPVDAIPDGIPVVGWSDDTLILVGGALNLIQVNIEQNQRTLAKILKLIKWGIILLGIILIVIVALLGISIFSIFK